MHHVHRVCWQNQTSRARRPVRVRYLVRALQRLAVFLVARDRRCELSICRCQGFEDGQCWTPLGIQQGPLPGQTVERNIPRKHRSWWPSGETSTQREGGRRTPLESRQWICTLVAIPCRVPGVIGSVLGLVGPVSVHCVWMRLQVWSAFLS